MQGHCELNQPGSLVCVFLFFCYYYIFLTYISSPGGLAGQKHPACTVTSMSAAGREGRGAKEQNLKAMLSLADALNCLFLKKKVFCEVGRLYIYHH